MNSLKDHPGGIHALAGVRRARKRPIPLQVHFATEADLSRTDGVYNAGHIRTRETAADDPGARFAPGDAIVTGTRGEVWPIPRAHFEATYVPAEPAGAFGTDGLFHNAVGPVSVLRMDEPFTMTATRGELVGGPGDYLVQYGPRDFGIVSADIFADTYEFV